MNCDTTRKQLSLMLYGELSFDEEERVHEHLGACAECEAEYGRVKVLHHSLDAAELPLPADLLASCRRDLRVGVAALGPAPRAGGWFDRVRTWWTPLPQFAGAVVLLALGFFGGRQAATERAPVASTDPVVSRVRYVQPDRDSRVQIVVEEVRQRVLSGELDDQNIRNLLLAATREANDPGVRVGTMDLLKGQSELSEVRRALLAALQHDTNPGVRLKAIEALREAGVQDNETRRTLAQVLLTDANPGIRTQAIDLLIQKREPALVGVLQELMTREENNYVRMKCQKTLAEMNASVESF